MTACARRWDDGLDAAANQPWVSAHRLRGTARRAAPGRTVERATEPGSNPRPGATLAPQALIQLWSTLCAGLDRRAALTERRAIPGRQDAASFRSPYPFQLLLLAGKRTDGLKRVLRHNPPMTSLQLVGFDADDTLWRSEDYFHAAQDEFERIVGAYVDLADRGSLQRLHAVEKGNLAVFGYGVKGMALSMVEAAVDITDGRVSGRDLHRIVQLAKDMLRHPVELLPGTREAVAAIAAEFQVVVITKGDLFHQEAKIRDSGLADLFGRIEIVSEKDPQTYLRVLAEFDVPPSDFAMIGNSLRSDIAPVLALGGWAVYMPYHLSWAYENEADDVSGHPRLREVSAAHELPAALADIAGRAPAATIAVD